MRVCLQLRSLAAFVAAQFALGAAAVAPLLAQEPPRFRLGAGLGADLVVGDASDFLDSGWSRFLMADFRLSTRDVFHLRLDAGLSPLADDVEELTGARAENDLLSFLAGPQLTATLGRLRPYIAGLAGFTVVHWSTEVPNIVAESATDDGTSSAFAWGGHAGLGLTLDRGDHPVVLQIEGRITDTGTHDFARTLGTDPRNPVRLINDDIAILSLRLAITLGF